MDELADLGRAAMVVRVGLVDHVAAGGAGLEQIGAGADRLRIEAGRVDIGFARQQVVRHDVHALPRPDERHIGALQHDLDRMVVDHLEAVDQVETAARARGNLGVDDGLVGEFDVLGGEGLAVAPFDVALQVDLPGATVRGNAAILAGRQLGGEVRDELALVVDVPERIEHQGLGNGVGAAIRIEQRVELHRFLGRAER